MSLFSRFVNHRKAVLVQHLPPLNETTMDRAELLAESRGRLKQARALQKRALPIAAKLREENDNNHFRERVEWALGGIQNGTR